MAHHTVLGREEGADQVSPLVVLVGEQHMDDQCRRRAAPEAQNGRGQIDTANGDHSPEAPTVVLPLWEVDVSPHVGVPEQSTGVVLGNGEKSAAAIILTRTSFESIVIVIVPTRMVMLRESQIDCYRVDTNGWE